MLRMSQSAYEEMRRHCGEAYPQEGCGMLIGDGESRTVTAAVPAKNASASPRNHYEIAPRDLIRVEREARAGGGEVIGFYHSHPDQAAHWSPTDLAEAHWLGFPYVITATQAGRATTTISFRLVGTTEEDKYFEAEEIEVIRK